MYVCRRSLLLVHVFQYTVIEHETLYTLVLDFFQATALLPTLELAWCVRSTTFSYGPGRVQVRNVHGAHICYGPISNGWPNIKPAGLIISRPAGFKACRLRLLAYINN